LEVIAAARRWLILVEVKRDRVVPLLPLMVWALSTVCASGALEAFAQPATPPREEFQSRH
jgi:hypothetical protein